MIKRNSNLTSDFESILYFNNFNLILTLETIDKNYDFLLEIFVYYSRT